MTTQIVDRRKVLQSMIASSVMTPCTLLPDEVSDSQRWIKIVDDWKSTYPECAHRRIAVHPGQLDGVNYYAILVPRNLNPDSKMLQNGYILCNMKVKL